MKQDFDLVVLGGGITGAGIARDAALRGLRVALCEKRDFGSGTSSKSSKLIHGGLRYLEHGEIGLVFESVSERAVQRRLAPHLVRPLPFLVPIYEGNKPGIGLMSIGLWIYDTLPLKRAVTLISPVDKRVVFAIPWRGRTVIGTTDTDFEGTADDCHADAADVEYLCRSATSYFPGGKFRPEDVIATWAGLRPLISDDANDASDVSREHQVFVRDDGVTIIAGGKLTTYRRMAKEAVKKTLRWLDSLGDRPLRGRKLRRPRTSKRPLPGAAGLPTHTMTGVRRLAKELAAKYDVPEPAAIHLANTYGIRATKLAAAIELDPALGEPMQDDLPYVWAEVDFAVTDDLARTIDDVLARRIPLLLVGRDQGLDVLDRVADRLTELLDWDRIERDRHLDAYRRTVADSRRFREAPVEATG